MEPCCSGIGLRGGFMYALSPVGKVTCGLPQPVPSRFEEHCWYMLGDGAVL